MTRTFLIPRPAQSFDKTATRENAMTSDEGAAEQIRELLLGHADMTERKMFGGLAFMRRGHMLVWIIGESLMARVGPAEHEAALKRPHVRKMDFTGKPMKGGVYIDPSGFESSRVRTWANGSIAASGSMQACHPNDAPQ